MESNMDSRLIQGIGLYTDPHQQAQVLGYFEQLKLSPDGWKHCGETLLKGTADENVSFFCFQVLEHFISNRFRASTPEDQQHLRQVLLSWLQLKVTSEGQEKNFIKNKVAQLFSLVFIYDFPAGWPTFFSTLLQVLQLGHKSVDMYLRILLAIDSEVVDREIVHTPEEAQRNTLLKDEMRVRCVNDLVESWYQILETYESTHPELACDCIEVIGLYVSWIDIGLIANDRFVSKLLNYLGIDVLRESACDCLHDIINKGMDPIMKTELIESLMKVLEEIGVIPPKQDEDVDFLAKLARLVNGMGCNLIISWQKQVKIKDHISAARTLSAVESKIPLMFQFLGHEDDDISLAVADFAKDYITVLKQIIHTNAAQKEFLKQMLYIILKKFEFDESYDFDSQGEDEAMFQDYRKQIKVIFDNLAQLDQQLVFSAVHQYVTTTLSSWKTVNFTQVELSIRILFMMGEAIPANSGNHFSGEGQRVAAMKSMMEKLITCDVVSHPHWIVGLQYMETVARYEKYFLLQQEHIPKVLVAFLDNRGLRHKHPTVRSRCSYLFLRFVKTLRVNLQPYTEEKLLLMKSLLAPTIEKFTTTFEKLCCEKDPNVQEKYAEVISYAISLASRSSKAFHTQATMKQHGCEGCYTEALEIFLQALNTPHQHQVLHSAVRQYLHRMIVCLGESVLPYIPIAVQHLLKQCEARDIQEFIPLINQLISKFKRVIAPFLQEVFMPIVTTIFNVLAQPSDQMDMQANRDKRSLQKGYFNFLQVLVINDLAEVMSNQEQQHFHQILMTIVEGAVDPDQDPVAQKTCFNILKRLHDVWGSKGVASKQFFHNFLYEYIIPAVFRAPFNFQDAQSMLALNEAASLLTTLKISEEESLLIFLQQKFLPVILHNDKIVEFINGLRTLDSKQFKTFFKTFFQQMRT
ncbi:exportin-T-like isoform X2 [Antedon mediterranea]|uniref:exportin-T-like isoform X2 n=1 Tax=Antedon mediterranea TaxID=105859 RepID=UPI003AF908F1